jgi:carbon-monoxide dehydrogenase catalytic subunit
MVEEGGLGDDIDQIPAVGLAPEWMSEKALAIGTYCVASGAYVLFGGTSPVSGMPDRVSESDIVADYISRGWEEIYGGKLEWVEDPDEMVRRTLDHIEKKREALGLRDYDPDNFGTSGDDRIMEMEELPIEKQREMLYGVAAD